ncbi:hypothetical protein IF1G_02943 [Cordyceps javanica]|uniref:Uncharacterized protein n=1 Tax=Cordyceps javanica TaxID=43265 RepID=A0A545VAX6_9HYPO|nr:hypothetical protein IF1G_02943 [Cordyceps javanica]
MTSHHPSPLFLDAALTARLGQQSTGWWAYCYSHRRLLPCPTRAPATRRRIVILVDANMADGKSVDR